MTIVRLRHSVQSAAFRPKVSPSTKNATSTCQRIVCSINFKKVPKNDWNFSAIPKMSSVLCLLRNLIEFALYFVLIFSFPKFIFLSYLFLSLFVSFICFSPSFHCLFFLYASYDITFPDWLLTVSFSHV